MFSGSVSTFNGLRKLNVEGHKVGRAAVSARKIVATNISQVTARGRFTEKATNDVLIFILSSSITQACAIYIIENKRNPITPKKKRGALEEHLFFSSLQ